jgi:hypothetical protein
MDAAGLMLAGSATALVLGGLAHALTYHISDDLIETSETVAFSNFMEEVKTGDLILVSSNSISSVTRFVTRSIWTHCGVVIRGTDERLYEWSSHSAREEVPNTLGIIWDGAQITPLEHLASDYGALFWRQLLLKKWQRMRIAQVVNEMAYRVPFSEKPQFAAYAGGLLGEALKGYGEGLACSHMVATTYMAADAIALDRDLTMYVPDTFSDVGNANWLVPVSTTRMVVGFDTSNLVKLSSRHRTTSE